MQRIGHSIPAGSEAFWWHNLSTAEGTEFAYDEHTDTGYEYAHDLGILAVTQESGTVYYRCSVDEFDELLIDTGNAGPAPCRECDSPTHREDAHG